LQCVALCCSVLQCVAVCCSVLQCVAECCSVLQCVSVQCSVLQCGAVCCSALQCVAVSCSVLQCPEGHFPFNCVLLHKMTSICVSKETYICTKTDLWLCMIRLDIKRKYSPTKTYLLMLIGLFWRIYMWHICVQRDLDMCQNRPIYVYYSCCHQTRIFTQQDWSLQHTATHCNTLQHIATHYNTMQHTATHCNVAVCCREAHIHPTRLICWPK